MTQSFVSAALLEMLVCPVCHGKIEQVGPAGVDAAWLRCLGCGRYYPIEDGLAVMIAERAIPHI